MLRNLNFAIQIWFARMVVGWARADSYLASNRGDYLQAARHESIAHEWERRLHMLLINRRYRYVR